MKDIQLSKHFKLSEFIKSSTATARKIDNTPTLEVVSNLQYLCVNVLEPLREYFNSPIVISSGYRCPKLNAAVGGVSSSQHMTGEACDIHIPDEATGKKWFEWMISNLRYHQLIWEKATPASTHHWIHVAIRQDGTNSQQVIRNLIKNK